MARPLVSLNLSDLQALWTSQECRVEVGYHVGEKVSLKRKERWKPGCALMGT